MVFLYTFLLKKNFLTFAFEQFDFNQNYLQVNLNKNFLGTKQNNLQLFSNYF